MTSDHPPTPWLFHAVEMTSRNPDARIRQAQASWEALYNQGVTPAHCTEVKRTAKNIGDRRELPYLKDVLSVALERMDDSDVLFWTNRDSFLHPDLVDYLLFHVSVYGACCSQRVDFKGSIPKNLSVEQLASKGGRCMGRDLFAAKKSWWVERWEQLGDPFLGASSFDMHIAAMIRLDYGVETTRKNLEEIIHPADIPLGYVCHQIHQPVWSQPRNIHTSPANQWNQKHFRNWSAKYLPNLKFNAQNEI